MRPSTSHLILVLALVVAPLSALAQDPVRSLNDLVGARGSSGEAELQARGYVFIKTTKSDDSAYSFWHEKSTGKCISVRTTDGKYASIVHTPSSDCGESSEPATAGSTAKKGFQTVCGVETGGKTYRYKCQVRTEGCGGQGFCRTFLTFPDNELQIDWHKNNQIEVKSTGVSAEKAKASVQDGQTRFDFGGNTYFFYRNEPRAKKEVAKFKG